MRYFVVSGKMREQVDDAQSPIEAAVIAYRRSAMRTGTVMLGDCTTVDPKSFDHVGVGTFFYPTDLLAQRVGLSVRETREGDTR